MIKGIKIALVSSVMLSGCVVTETINGGIASLNNSFTTAELPITYTKAAKESGTEKMKRLAVISNNRNAATGIIETNLANIRVNGQPYFTFVDKASLSKIIEQQRFNESDISNSKNRTRLGKLTGADTLITADYTADVDTSTYYEKDSECIQKGDKWYKCEKSREITIKCSEKIAKVNFKPKAVSVETGQIVFTKQYSRLSSSKVCKGDDPHPSDSVLRGRALAAVIEELKQDVAPHQVTKNVKLMESDDSDLTDKAEELLDLAVEFAEKDMPDHACKTFAKAQSQYSESLAINYNNGVCAERANDLELAKAYYEKASNLTLDVDELKFVIEGQTRLVERESDNAKLTLATTSNRL
ncbi:hypothetical protein NDQ71_19020 [Pseudoalteromonas sp. KG3]|uniref:Curli production assembly/transport component CsgG n=1 Tax=Pseudoalteromonas prydzensis TaxID=182141 RepID=A0ABR9FGR2_9GAMM|nr:MULTISPECIES: hypothetical protein [Pseudoalteromonas]MBE0455987.1 hypothetical protein [Pseudoalteromonas prydzensis]WKD25904.1 hypothetical protein NDQ71_19020 [Pseudoalteromonas sp. KG3]